MVIVSWDSMPSYIAMCPLNSYRKPKDEVREQSHWYKHRSSVSDIEAAGGLTMKELQNEEKLSLITAAEQDALGETII